MVLPMSNYNGVWFNPPAPVAHVTLRDPDNGRTIENVPVLLDTGADVTLLPRSFVKQLGANLLPDTQYETIGFDGNSSLSDVVGLEMVFLERTFRGRFLLIDQEWGIIGRNVLNSLMLLFDGRNLEWKQHRP